MYLIDILINIDFYFYRFIGFLVILALLFFTPYFAFIPKASLAAIIIAAVVFMVEVKVVRPMWRSKSKYSIFLRDQLPIGKMNLIPANMNLDLMS